jgi:N-acetylglucosamine-6-sulfatase
VTNFVIVCADDMREDLLRAMPLTRAAGTRFRNMHNANPVCGASRASALTGLLSRSTQIYGNNPPFGGERLFRQLGLESRTIAVYLQDAGYHTALMGKYLNGYDTADIGHVPKGWSTWLAIAAGGERYFKVQFSEDGTSVVSPPGVYLTHYLADRAVAYIRQRAMDGLPFLLWLTPVAPHREFVPAPMDARTFRDLPPWRPPTFNEPDMSDKPRFYRNLPLLTPDRIQEIDELRVRQYQTVQGLDRLVDRVVQELKDSGLLSDTLILFWSDNGYLWGEHRLVGKGVPYLEATRSPLVIRWAGNSNPKTDAVLSNVDIAPTIVDIAGVPADPFDGTSFRPQLEGRAGPETVYVEHHTLGRRPAWATAQRANRTYIWSSTGEEEWYNLEVDPLQRYNRLRVGTRPAADDLRAGREFVRDELAHGMPPGMTRRPPTG